MSKNTRNAREKFLVLVLDEEYHKLLEIEVTTDGKESHVTLSGEDRMFSSVWSNVSTALGACAFWLWKLTHREHMFEGASKADELEDLPF